MRRLAEFPLVGIWGEKFRSGGSHEDDVFDATGAETGVVKAGLDGHDGVFSQNVINGAAHPGQLVHGETEAMTGAMADENVARHTEGKSIRKVIFIPDRLLNIVVG